MRASKACCIAFLLLFFMATMDRVQSSPGFDDIVTLAKSGVTEEKLLEFVKTSTVSYDLTVEEILFLSDLGLSAETIEAINMHDFQAPASTPSDTNIVTQVATNMVDLSVVSSNEPPVEVPTGGVTVAADAAPLTMSMTAADTTDYTFFYEGLAPYGTWMDWDGGWYWQPTACVVNPDWKPYCQGGHWIYTASGWMWMSSYSWGWGPFHYGRWRHHPRYGWLWLPGNVWAPAWVCWRYSDAVVGWAPLPPEADFDANHGLCVQSRPVDLDYEFGLVPTYYTFVPARHFCDSNVSQNRVKPEREPGIYRITTTVDNRYRYENHRACNAGPPVKQIEVTTHKEFPPIKIVDVTPRPGEPIRRPAIANDKVMCYRPRVVSTVRMTPDKILVRRQAQVDVHPTSPHGANVTFTRQTTVIVPPLHPYKPKKMEPPSPVKAPVSPVSPPPPVSLNQDRFHEAAIVIKQRQEKADLQYQMEKEAAIKKIAQQQQKNQQIQQKNEIRQQIKVQVQQQTAAEQQQKVAEAIRKAEESRKAAQQQDVQRKQDEARRIQTVLEQQDAQRHQRAKQDADDAAARRLLEIQQQLHKKSDPADPGVVH